MATQIPLLIDFNPSSAVFSQDVISEATLPLLNFLWNSDPERFNAETQ